MGSLLFLWSLHNLRVFHLGAVGQPLRRRGLLGAFPREAEPVDQLGQSIHQAADADDHKCRRACPQRIEQGKQAGQKYQHRHHVEPRRHPHPTAGRRERGQLLHPAHHQDKAQHIGQQVGKETRHGDEPQPEQQASDAQQGETYRPLAPPGKVTDDAKQGGYQENDAHGDDQVLGSLVGKQDQHQADDQRAHGTQERITERFHRCLHK